LPEPKLIFERLFALCQHHIYVLQKPQIRRSFKATVNETTWNSKHRRKRTINTKNIFWANSVTELNFNK